MESFQADKARNNKELKTLKNGNEHLSGKLCKIEENDQFMNENRSLRKKVDDQFNEILSLKSQHSSIFICDEKDTEICWAKELKELVVNSERYKKPMALSIGTSNANGTK